MKRIYSCLQVALHHLPVFFLQSPFFRRSFYGNEHSSPWANYLRILSFFGVDLKEPLRCQIQGSIPPKTSLTEPLATHDPKDGSSPPSHPFKTRALLKLKWFIPISTIGKKLLTRSLSALLRWYETWVTIPVDQFQPMLRD
jgi:hypothetical protein